MASSTQSLGQQRPNVEARLKTLVNNDLKEICKAYGKPVSGTKAMLQARCLEVLNNIVRASDNAGFDVFRYRTNNHGQSPPTPNPPAKFATHGQQYAPAYSSSNMSPSKINGSSTASRAPSSRHHFRPSPFYEVLETLLPLQDLPDMPQNRHTVRVHLSIRAEIAQQMRNESDLKIMMYCGVTSSLTAQSNADISFPSQIEVKINDQDVRSNFKGLKNKPGSTKPADVTSFIRKYHGQQNTVSVTYALTTKRYAFMVCLVRYVSPAQLTEKIKKGKVIPRDNVLQEMRQANSDPDIAATSIRMSLKDPVSTMRITLPIRSTICRHNQCFDGEFFMQLQDQAPQWSCPVCNKALSFESLCIDKYFEDILHHTPKSIEKVDLEPNGEWRMIEEEEVGKSNGPRASYDDDFDEEAAIDLDSSPGPIAKANSHDPGYLALPPPSAVHLSWPGHTPPVSSREQSVAQSNASVPRSGQKRPAPELIDLISSSEDEDDDEPPQRPAKRHQPATLLPSHLNTSRTSNTTASGGSAYGTPNSLSQDRRYSSSFANAANTQHQSEPYRSMNLHSNSHHPRTNTTSSNHNHTTTLQQHQTLHQGNFPSSQQPSPPYPPNHRSYHSSQSPHPASAVHQTLFSTSPFAGHSAWPAPKPGSFPPKSPLGIQRPLSASQQTSIPALGNFGGGAEGSGGGGGGNHGGEISTIGGGATMWGMDFGENPFSSLSPEA